LSSIDFGLIPNLIQFFATWFNQTKSGKIIFNLKSEDDLAEFYEADYIFPSVTYCWSRQILDSDGNDIKPLLKIQNQYKHDRMRKQTEGGGLKVLLACFDHLSIKNGLLNAFYTDGIFISNEMLFDFAIGKSIRQATSLNHDLRSKNLAPVYEDIIAIVYELMKNTDDWGRTDEFNKPLNPNSRGVFLKLHRRKRKDFSFFSCAHTHILFFPHPLSNFKAFSKLPTTNRIEWSSSFSSSFLFLVSLCTRPIDRSI
jgi:hypothetical protein